MSKVRLYGDTSGYVDLKAPDVANDVTITLPNETGPFATEAYADSASKLVAVKHALFTGTQTNSTAAGANFAVTDLSITHAMSSASNKLIISAYFGVAASSHDPASVGLAVADGATLIGVGAAAGDRTQVGAGGWQQGAGVTSSNIVVARMSVMFVYEPGDTASHTYTVRALNVVENTRTIYIGRTQDDTDYEYNPRGASGFVIQEVKA